MNNSEFLKLMDELGIPKENIIEQHEPQYSLEVLQNLEKCYGIDTSDVIKNQLSTENPLTIDKCVYEKWIDAFETFTEYKGDMSLIDTCKNEFILPNIDFQEAEFINSASFFVQ
ncbi:hypothetical protein Nizo3892_1301 [Lactiplantibacillus plantarum]|uniref:hypothetical protein n=1 Tax=Lactiplantibacillus plantarum TaxID=1590 RepID=UPI000629E465|nr:hypothetical protein [Lactiplantibacillus plantarum]KZT93134.1 hypothetical protein Nizo2258_2531 [Lactiplantibacillus plantarum]KZT94149.1 hypothetical protein Nizo2257_2440 [Lactiplantibacillus plantarum]KZU81604.1 hypothetical protein Nizo3892_1301 [Lactiplantibacillus plantarum]